MFKRILIANRGEIACRIIKIIPAETARKYQILPLSRSGATLTRVMPRKCAKGGWSGRGMKVLK